MAEETDQPLTMSVPAAGKKFFNLERDASYNAAKAGFLPVVKIGRNLRVPIRALEKMLDAAVPKAASEK
jgi:hypothetical protein